MVRSVCLELAAVLLPGRPTILPAKTLRAALVLCDDSSARVSTVCAFAPAAVITSHGVHPITGCRTIRRCCCPDVPRLAWACNCRCLGDSRILALDTPFNVRPTQHFGHHGASGCGWSTRRATIFALTHRPLQAGAGMAVEGACLVSLAVMMLEHPDRVLRSRAVGAVGVLVARSPPNS